MNKLLLILVSLIVNRTRIYVQYFITIFLWKCNYHVATEKLYDLRVKSELSLVWCFKLDKA